MFLENYNSSADLAHQVLQNLRLSWRSGLTDSKSNRCFGVRANLAHQRHTMAHIISGFARHSGAARNPGRNLAERGCTWLRRCSLE